MATPNKLPFGSKSPSKNLLSGAGGALGAGHATPGAAPLKNLAPQSAKKAAETKQTEDHSITAAHNFGNTPGQHGQGGAKGGGNAVPRRTAPGA